METFEKYKNKVNTIILADIAKNVFQLLNVPLLDFLASFAAS